MKRGHRRAFNLVEILITLTLLSILTMTIITYVSDYQTRVKMVRAKNDIMRIAQMAMYAESRMQTLVTTISDTGTDISTTLDPFLLKLPSEDPWGNRYLVGLDGSVTKSTTSGVSYIIDKALGRVISAGPDAVVDTQIGQGTANNIHDIVFDYRHKPWIFYFYDGKMGIARPDGSEDKPFLDDKSAEHVTVSPNSTKVAGLVDMMGNWFVFSAVIDEINPGRKITATQVPSNCVPLWFPNSRHLGVVDIDYSFRVIDTGVSGSVLTANPITGPNMLKGAFNSVGTGAGRSLYSSDKVSCYIVAENDPAGAYMTVSRDGKIAYADLWSSGTNEQGIHVVLLDRTGHKKIIINEGVKRYVPIMWISETELMYLELSDKVLYRCRQDGSYQFALHKHQTSGQWPKEHPMAICPSRDRSILSFRSNPAANPGLYLLRTDGTGFLVDYPSKTSVVVPYTDQNHVIDSSIIDVPVLWTSRERRNRNPPWTMLYVPLRVAGNPNTLQETAMISRLYHSPLGGISTISANQDQDINISAVDLDASENLIAIASASQGGASKSAGIYVYSLNGPQGAITQIVDWGAGSGGYAYIRWLTN